jgi:predicted acetyltransferase
VPELIAPSTGLHSSFLTALREEQEAGESMSAAYLFDGDIATLTDPDCFADYVARLLVDGEEDTPRPEHFVPGSTLWWVDGGEFLGRVGIRHRLNDRLRYAGGHIGYWIRPSQRRKGHARAAFLACLPYANRLGIDPALVTCDADNIGSRRIIEAAGGDFEQQIGDKRLYWVPTAG